MILKPRGSAAMNLSALCRRSRIFLLSAIVALSYALSFATVSAEAGERLTYNRDIRPILADNCFRCHGPDSAARQGELRLDKFDAAAEMGAITPEKPDESELIRRIFSEDPDEVMPPPTAHKVLSPEQKDMLREWIAQGAIYERHWSLIPPVRPALPAVNDPAWVKNPIDRFILQKLEEKGLSPADEADRWTLARRVSLDLVGLPPSPEAAEAFMRDPSPDAFERYVDGLLSSPRWGEHRGRYWLDAARYADTHGIHFDNYREMWTWREWVISAFNRNLPFDQFTIEQLAGDLLPNRTLDQQIASGFNRCNITTNEGGVIAEEYLVLYTRDRTETAAQVFLGTTAGCAVCHDHKFDPLSQREFYELAAYFNNTTQGAMDGNIKDTPPIVMVPLDRDRARWEALPTELADAQAAIEARKSESTSVFSSWLASASRETLVSLIPTDGLALHIPNDDGPGLPLHYIRAGESREQFAPEGLVWEAGHVSAHVGRGEPGLFTIPDSGDFDKEQPFTCSAWVKLDKTDQAGAFVARMDEEHDYRGWDLWFENGRVGSHLIHKWQEDAIKAVGKKPIKAGEWTHVAVSYDGSAKAEGLRIYVGGEAQAKDVTADSLKNTTRTEVPLKVGQRSKGQALSGLAIADVRLYERTLEAVEIRHLALATRAAYLAGKPEAERSDAERTELFTWYLDSMDQPYQDLRRKSADLEAEKSAIQGRGTIAHVMQEKPEVPSAFILFRGDYDKRRDAVSPDTPDFLPPFPPELPKNRLGLAQWLLSPDQPLLARVTVNRFWQELFGTGIVKTSGDFGVAGELPSNQELLDWLAVEFRESGWDVKGLARLMVTSAAYRQSAAATQEKLDKDPQNRFLSRGPRFRMDGEAIRDSALAASGLLAPVIGGPSVRPYQPEGVWEAVAMIGSNTRDYKQDAGANLYRRSLYTFWKRSAPPASMDIFNAPSREVCTVRRERTNTPLQALVTLNDPQFVEAARRLAEEALREGGPSDNQRITWLANRVLTRPLTAEERDVLKGSLAELLSWYQAHGEEARQLIAVGESKADPALAADALAAWTLLANEMLNLDEVLNK
jgi:cytochrome c553